MARASQLADVEFAELCCRDEWVELTDHELHRAGERAHDIRRVFSVSNRRDRGDERVGVPIEQLLVRRADVVKELRRHHAPQSFRSFAVDQRDRVRSPGASFIRIGVGTRADEQQSAHPLGRVPRQRERAVAAHRRSDDGEVAFRLAGDRTGPAVHRLPPAVQPRRNQARPPR